MRVHVSIRIRDRKQVEVHAVQQVGDFFVSAAWSFQQLQSRQTLETFVPTPKTFKVQNEMFQTNTSWMMYVEVAGDIHSLAWMPKSSQIADFFSPVLCPICEEAQQSWHFAFAFFYVLVHSVQNCKLCVAFRLRKCTTMTQFLRQTRWCQAILDWGQETVNFIPPKVRGNWAALLLPWQGWVSCLHGSFQ